MKNKSLFSCFCFGPDKRCNVVVLDYRHHALHQVPAEVFTFERTLEALHLDGNEIKDLSRDLFHCFSLRKLTISDNDVTSIPSAIDRLTCLEELDCSKNGLLELPESLKACKFLTHLDASVNPLGKLPDGFTQLLSLTHINLNDTFLEYLPGNFGRLELLKTLELRENNLKTLPVSMNRLKRLRTLDIGVNDFTEFPRVIGQLTALVELWMDSNQISQIPSEIGQLTQLVFLDASKNRLTSMSPALGRCQLMGDLCLSQNNLTELPHQLGQLANLTSLRLDDNQLASLPPTLGGLEALSELNIRSNDIRFLPEGIGRLRNLRTVIADENMLEKLPAELGGCSSVTVLSLRANNLQELTDEIGRLQLLRVLNVSENRLAMLPYSLTRLKQLQALWLSETQAKPLIPLQSEVNPSTGRRQLTCYLLPQQSNAFSPRAGSSVPADDVEGRDTGLGSSSVNSATNASSTAAPHQQSQQREPRIQFAVHDQNNCQPSAGGSMRSPTPFPKEGLALPKHDRNAAVRGNGIAVGHGHQQSLLRTVSSPLDVSGSSGLGNTSAARPPSSTGGPLPPPPPAMSIPSVNDAAGNSYRRMDLTSTLSGPPINNGWRQHSYTNQPVTADRQFSGGIDYRGTLTQSEVRDNLLQIARYARPPSGAGGVWNGRAVVPMARPNAPLNRSHRSLVGVGYSAGGLSGSETTSFVVPKRLQGYESDTGLLLTGGGRPSLQPVPASMVASARYVPGSHQVGQPDRNSVPAGHRAPPVASSRVPPAHQFISDTEAYQLRGGSGATGYSVVGPRRSAVGVGAYLSGDETAVTVQPRPTRVGQQHGRGYNSDTENRLSSYQRYRAGNHGRQPRAADPAETAPQKLPFKKAYEKLHRLHQRDFVQDAAIAGRSNTANNDSFTGRNSSPSDRSQGVSYEPTTPVRSQGPSQSQASTLHLPYRSANGPSTVSPSRSPFNTAPSSYSANDQSDRMDSVDLAERPALRRSECIDFRSKQPLTTINENVVIPIQHQKLLTAYSAPDNVTTTCPSSMKQPQDGGRIHHGGRRRPAVYNQMRVSSSSRVTTIDDGPAVMSVRSPTSEQPSFESTNSFTGSPAYPPAPTNSQSNLQLSRSLDRSPNVSETVSGGGTPVHLEVVSASWTTSSSILEPPKRLPSGEVQKMYSGFVEAKNYLQQQQQLSVARDHLLLEQMAAVEGQSHSSGSTEDSGLVISRLAHAISSSGSSTLPTNDTNTHLVLPPPTRSPPSPPSSLASSNEPDPNETSPLHSPRRRGSVERELDTSNGAGIQTSVGGASTASTKGLDTGYSSPSAGVVVPDKSKAVSVSPQLADGSSTSPRAPIVTADEFDEDHTL